jgi:hypothetical protein
MNAKLKQQYSNWNKCNISISFLDYIRVKMQSAIEKKQYQKYSDLLDIECEIINR